MDFSIIVGTNKKNGIGYYNKSKNKYTIPWYNSEDLKYFKMLTTEYKNTALIMGKNTFISLPNGPLQKRLNIVITKDENLELNYPIKTFKSLEQALNYCNNIQIEKCFVIGGSRLYREALENTYLQYIYWNILENEEYCNINFPIDITSALKYFDQYSLPFKVENTKDLTYFKLGKKY